MEGLPVHPWLPFLRHFWQPNSSHGEAAPQRCRAPLCEGCVKDPMLTLPRLFLRWADTPQFRGFVKTRSSASVLNFPD